MDISQPDMLDDVSALAWVQDELRKSLEGAHKALRRALRETESTYDSDLDDVEPTLLRTARQQLHQGVGVLELVGLPAGATLLRASEALVQRYIAKPHKLDIGAVEAIERASYALLDLLARRLGGKSVSPVALFPQYRVVQELAGAERVHPADLWPQDWQWRALAPEADVAPRRADAAFGTEFERQVLVLMRNSGPAVLVRLGDLSAGLAAGAAQSHAATLWRLGAAFFEAQALGLLVPDVYCKRLTSRLLAQLRAQQRGDATAGERLAQDLLFFCTHARDPQAGQAPRLSAVLQAYPRRSEPLPADYSIVTLGRYDPAWVTQAKKRVATAKDTWSAVAGGEMHRLSGLNEQFSLVADSLKRLVPGGEQLADALARAVGRPVQSASAPQPQLAMEVATSVLYLEATLEDGAFDHADQAPRVKRLAQRIDAVLGGAAPEPLEVWMEELYRRVSDRQTMGSVVHELRSALSESEKLIDQFFRAPTEPAVLMPVPAQLQAMRGVFSVLGLDQATLAVLRMRDDVDAFVTAGTDARHQQPLFERLAGNLSALSFLIDLLGVQPQVAKTMFRFDAASGLLVSQMVRRSTSLQEAAVSRLEPALIAQAQSLASAASSLDMPLAQVSRELERLSLEPDVLSQSQLAASLSSARAAIDRTAAPYAKRQTEASAREQVADALADFVSTASDPVGLDSARVSAPLPLISLVPAAAVELTGLEADAEMRDIFLEEAREVLETARGALTALQAEPSSVEQLTNLRRVFHTFKGSSRMVGLREFGEASWACEQLYNAVLASQQAARPELLRTTGEALDHLSGWVDAIAAGNVAGWHSAPLCRVADSLRRSGRYLSLEDARPAPTPVASSAPITFVLPAASELDLVAPVEAPLEPVAAPHAATPIARPVSGLDFRFDLGDGEAAVAPVKSEEATARLEPEAPEVAASPDDAPRVGAVQFDEFETFVDVVRIDVPMTDDEFDIAATMPMALLIEDAPLYTASPEEPLITTLELDMPAPGAALEIAPLIQPLHPKVPVASDFKVVSANETFEEGVPPSEPIPAEPSLIEPGDGVHVLQPSDHDAGTEAVELIEVPEVEELAQAAEAYEPNGAYDDQLKVVGSLRVSIPLFNIYLNEADELSRRLGTELSEWALELQRPVGETAIALAHSLAGSSATVGFADLSALARQLEHALLHSQTLGRGRADDARLFNDVADEVRRLLHQFAAGFLRSPPPELLQRLAAYEIEMAQRLTTLAATQQEEMPVEEPVSLSVPAALVPTAEPVALAVLPPRQAQPPPQQPADSLAGSSSFTEFGQTAYKPFVPHFVDAPRPVSRAAFDSEQDIDSVDMVDLDLFPIFEEEAQELLPELASHLRDWAQLPQVVAHATASMRTLHTLKGGARLAGAMRLGELAHRLETAIEHLVARETATAPEVEQLLDRADGLGVAFEALRQRDAAAYAAAPEALQPLADTPDVHVVTTAWPPLDDAPTYQPEPVLPDFADPVAADAVTPLSPSSVGPAMPSPVTPLAAREIDWARFALGAAAARLAPAERAPLASVAAVRVRTQLLDRLVNQAGEVSIARARLESEVGQIKNSLGDLTDNLERLRQQLRDIELQAETQMSTRMEAAKVASQSFDPLEFDRFTRFQEITRMMAESVNDVATVQRALQRTLQIAEDELAVQARLTRDLQDDLLRTRMVEFEGLSERLYRVVRQAAKETGKQVRLDIVGGSIEVDRGVLDRMTGAFEHLLRNCVTHGVESPEQRVAAGKEPVGSIVVALHQEGNEVSVEFRDDGAGLDMARIRDKGVAAGFIDAGAVHADVDLANLIFMPGFTTAEAVTELAGRGVGLDVVRADVNALGGRIETASAIGQGTSFKLVLPLTTAVTQVVMLRCGEATVAVPSKLVEIVRRATPADIEVAYASGAYIHNGQPLPFFWLGALLQISPRGGDLTARSLPVVVIRSAQQRMVLHVDEVLGNQEVVVKNLGPQLSRLPGLAGVTLLASGAVALIYNPVALATVYGEAARQAMVATHHGMAGASLLSQPALAAARAPLVLVVDDSLTVRRVTQRLLAREGYRVVLAKDGLDALERLAEERPTVVLSDIEMPRMDGFDLVRNIRSDAHLRALPVIMITSRIAQKHRDYASELGVNHYLGKPYGEEELLALVARYCTALA